MNRSANYLLLAATAVFLLIQSAGCRIPRVPVRQTFDLAGEFTVKGERVRHYRTRDFSTLDTSEAITKLEYLPIDLFAVLDSRDSVKMYLVSAWQEYIWRFSERLSSVDRKYYAPVPMWLKPGGDTALMIWGYPTIEGRDRDIRYAVKRRNDYWSIDLFAPNDTPDELWVGVLQSFPQFSGYDPQTRFVPGGMYQRTMASDTTAILKLMRKELNKALGQDEGDGS